QGLPPYIFRFRIEQQLIVYKITDDPGILFQFSFQLAWPPSAVPEVKTNVRRFYSSRVNLNKKTFEIAPPEYTFRDRDRVFDISIPVKKVQCVLLHGPAHENHITKAHIFHHFIEP